MLPTHRTGHGSPAPAGGGVAAHDRSMVGSTRATVPYVPVRPLGSSSIAVAWPALVMRYRSDVRTTP